MSLYYYRSCKMLYAFVILITHSFHGSEMFSITRADNANEPLISNISGDMDVPAAESSNILKLTKPSKEAEEKYASNPNSTGFSLTTRVSIDNETSKEVITTADGILTVKPSSIKEGKYDTKATNTVVDNIHTSSYPAYSVTTGVAMKTNDIKGPEITTMINKDTNIFKKLRPIDDVTIYDNEINTNKKMLSDNNNNLMTSTVSDYATKNNVQVKVTTENREHQSEKNITTEYTTVLNIDTSEFPTSLENNSQYNIQDNNLLKDDEFQNALETKNAKLSRDNEESQGQSADKFTVSQKYDSSRMELNPKDLLSVQPITSESKPKNSTLYTVKASYRRPKKLEITQPKPFMRDPNDISWRNESISSLGIVFKANNTTKPFTLVLKNKTENDFNAIMQKLEKDESNFPELKERLGKLSERRKSKKKRPGSEDKYYDEPIYPEISTVYAVPYDYDESKQESPGNKGVASTESPKMINFFDELENMFDEEKIMRTSLELMKSTTPKTIEVVVTPSSPAQQYKPDRKPTIQYFPPRDKNPPKPKIKLYDNRFDERINSYTTTETSQMVFPISLPPIQPGTHDRNTYNQEALRNPIKVTHDDIKKDLHNVATYDTNTERRSTNSPPYGIKHFRDYDDIVTKGLDRNIDKNAFEATYANIVEASVPNNVHYNNYYTNEGIPNAPKKGNVYYKDDLKYDNGFHPGRFSVSYPVLINNSVIHNTNVHGRVSASSSAFMKRLYEGRSADGYPNNCDPECERLALELQPDYELHFYVPGQEENEPVEPKLTPFPILQIKHLQPIRFYDAGAP